MMLSEADDKIYQIRKKKSKFTQPRYVLISKWTTHLSKLIFTAKEHLHICHGQNSGVLMTNELTMNNAEQIPADKYHLSCHLSEGSYLLLLLLLS